MADLSAMAAAIDMDIAIPTGAVVIVEAMDDNGDMALYTVASDGLPHWRVVGMCSWAMERAQRLGADDD